jgi:hypothetical protein
MHFSINIITSCINHLVLASLLLSSLMFSSELATIPLKIPSPVAAYHGWSTWAGQGLCVLTKRERQDVQSSFGMTRVVAQTSSDGRKPSTAEQAHSGITQSGHDFGSMVCMNGTSIFSHGNIFDVMQAIFDGPMSPLEFE